MWRNGNSNAWNTACRLATGIKTIIMINFSEITEQKITEKYEDLPQDLKDVLSSVSTSTAIENIAAKYRLDEEKTTMLIQLVGLAILGFVSFEDMKEEMKETISIDLSIIPLIAEEIRQKIFLPVMNSLQKVITEKRPPVTMPAPTAVSPTPQPVTPTQKPVDEYREPASSVPEVVDLRKKPLPAPSLPPPTPTAPSKPIMSPMPITPTPSALKPVTPPLTFTQPIQPLIEAEPHQIPAPEPRPQYIMRPSGAPPTDLPDNVLDLRKDKGEF